MRINRQSMRFLCDQFSGNNVALAFLQSIIFSEEPMVPLGSFRVIKSAERERERERSSDGFRQLRSRFRCGQFGGRDAMCGGHRRPACARLAYASS